MERRRRASETSLVKSARRALELVEFLAGCEDGAQLMDIARSLDFPQSSTTALLKTLMVLGYVGYRRRGRSYHLTARAAMLGARAGSQIYGDGQLLTVMEELRAATGEAVLLAMRNGLSVRLIEAVKGDTPIAVPLLRLRGIRSLTNSGSGRLFLATLPTTEMRAIVRRLNAENTDPAQRVDLCALEQDLDAIRRQGYAVATETTVPGIGGLAVLVPTRQQSELVAVILAAPIEKIQSEQLYYLDTIKAVLDRHRGAAI